jgi:hypothetical protein
VECERRVEARDDVVEGDAEPAVESFQSSRRERFDDIK